MKPSTFHAETLRLTVEDGKPYLVIGQGNHDALRFQITWDQVRGFVLDAVPQLLKP